MKKRFLFFILIFSFFMTWPSFLSFAQSDFGMITATGRIKGDEVGGQGLHIFSIWHSGSKAWVGQEGTFSVSVLSSARPQRISVRDINDQTRALALVFSDDAQRIVIDALSTAIAVLFSDPNWIQDSLSMRQYLRVIEEKKVFQELVLFLKRKLPEKTLEALARDEEFQRLVHRCEQEIFNVDHSSIMRSLHEAQDQLEDSFR